MNNHEKRYVGYVEDEPERWVEYYDKLDEAIGLTREHVRHLLKSNGTGNGAVFDRQADRIYCVILGLHSNKNKRDEDGIEMLMRYDRRSEYLLIKTIIDSECEKRMHDGYQIPCFWHSSSELI